MIRITAKIDGFRRCGIAHGKQPAEYPDNTFSKKELATLKSEPNLSVEVVAEGKPNGKKPTEQ
jgi:hypothetical protein